MYTAGDIILMAAGQLRSYLVNGESHHVTSQNHLCKLFYSL